MLSRPVTFGNLMAIAALAAANMFKPLAQMAVGGAPTSASGRSSGSSNRRVQRAARKARNVRRHKHHMRRSRGFSSIEALIGLVIVSVWMAWGGSLAEQASDWHRSATDTELRCVYGYQFIAGPDDTLVQVVDETGLGVHCDKTPQS